MVSGRGLHAAPMQGHEVGPQWFWPSHLHCQLRCAHVLGPARNATCISADQGPLAFFGVTSGCSSHHISATCRCVRCLDSHSVSMHADAGQDSRSAALHTRTCKHTRVLCCMPNPSPTASLLWPCMQIPGGPRIRSLSRDQEGRKLLVNCGDKVVRMYSVQDAPAAPQGVPLGDLPTRLDAAAIKVRCRWG